MVRNIQTRATTKTIAMSADFLTAIEKQVYKIIRKQAERICKDDDLTNQRLFNSVLSMCSIWSLTKHFSDANIEPEKAVEVINSLVSKKMLRVYEYDMLHSFVPLEYSIIKGVEGEKEMKDDIDYKTGQWFKK